MKTRLQTPTTTRKMRKRAFRTRSEIYFRVLGPASAIDELAGLRWADNYRARLEKKGTAG